jgi:hypothetical protein
VATLVVSDGILAPPATVSATASEMRRPVA